ncbi:MAG TPA: hypothetical protein VN969_14840 [Streptosporangiaceae bacterium]|nr:hypothetical protein [Streptosporangiaceae bacterium]
MSNQSTEEQLRAGMARFTADVTAAPEGLAMRTIRHRRRHAIATVTGTAGAVAIAVAVFAAVAVTGSAPAHPAGQQVKTAAYVISRTESALGAAGSENLVENYRYTTINGSEVEFENVGPASDTASIAMWTYGQHVKLVTYADGGRLGSVSGWSTSGKMTTTTADYQNKTWWRRMTPGISPYSAVPGCRAAVEVSLQGPWETGYGDLAAALRTALRCGQYTLAGTQRVDGVETVELKLVPSADSPVRQTFWVNSSSYLPVRSVAANYSMPGSVWEYQTDYRWLQPTSANVAEVNVAIPAGFTQVPAPVTP